MLITVISWCMISVYIFTIGLAVACLIERSFSYKIKQIHSVGMAGIVGAAVYAETFSLFYKVGFLAILILTILCVLFVLLNHKKVYLYVRELSDISNGDKHNTIGMLVFGVSVIIFGAYLTSKAAIGYDTLNYHIPGIRWLEEYGVVKGLGNLHTRFAYNSAFLCLQALFSFKWIYGSSLHSMNGYIWVFMIVSTVLSFSFLNRKNLSCSDILRVLFLYLLLRSEELVILASPNTDLMPMCLIGYIFIDWVVLLENNEENYVPYGLLSVLGLFCASVKLSAAIMFVVATAPIFQIIKTKKYGDLLKFAFIGIVSILPFLLRNILLSGYLLYPVDRIDIFDLDWEIPRSVIVSDNVMIKAYARAWGNGYAYTDISRSFGEWFKLWVLKSNGCFGMLAIVNIILAIISCIFVIYCLLKKEKNIFEVIPIFEAAIGFLFLFFSAPLIRFGRIWFYLLPVLFFYSILSCRIAHITNGERISNKINNICNIITRDSGLIGFVMISFIFICGLCAYSIKNDDNIRSIFNVSPVAYGEEGDDGQTYNLNGMDFYYYLPDEEGINHLNGYYGFPGTECLPTLTRIEFRGDGLEDGFRVKKDCEDIPYDFQGNVLDDLSIKAMNLDRYY